MTWEKMLEINPGVDEDLLRAEWDRLQAIRARNEADPDFYYGKPFFG